ncbi:Eco57I restriction-modification methylase domain-containing protein, partial [Myroides odoratimimus]|nr:SAM-dependent methyltransferase [Myroides odoratimimus]
MEVCLNLNIKKGLMGMINQHSWMFLSSYEKLREELLNNYSIVNMIHLGPRTFEELSGEVVQSTAFVCENGNDIKEGTYFRLVDYRNNTEKEAQFLQRNNQYCNITQTNFSKIPGSPIAYWIKPWEVNVFGNEKSFDTFASPSKGMMPGSSFLLFNWEVDKTNVSTSINAEESEGDERRWYRYFKGGSYRKWYGNQEHLVLFYQNGKVLKENNYGERNPQHYFKRQINWSKIASGKFSARDGIIGGLYDDAACQCPVHEE